MSGANNTRTRDQHLRLLFIGDIVGRPGRRWLIEHLSKFRKAEAIDLCIANGENMAGGAGMTVETVQEVFAAGVDVITSGDHVWKHKEIVPFIERNDRVLRPANYSPLAAGRGHTLVETSNGRLVGVINLVGRVFMGPADCPFRAADAAVAKLAGHTRVIVLDFHAEATSEKIAMGWHLDGRVSAVVGTHTHVQTADARILPQGTAYITDIGMTGAHDSILGRRTDRVLKALITQMPTHFDVAKENVKMCGAIVTIDVHTGRAVDIRAVQEPL